MSGFWFNGRHSTEFNILVLRVKRSIHAPVRPRLITVPGKAGAYNFGNPEIEYTTHEVSIAITGGSNENYHKLKRQIAGWLFSNVEKELIFDDESGKSYLAMFVDSGELDRLGSYGEATLSFVSSDPFASGKKRKQRIAVPDVVFNRKGIRYRDEGTEVTENYPVFMPGKFKESVLIEEGTENLLPSASEPKVEELTVIKGEDYSLSTIGGSAKIEHMKVEEIKENMLEKEGEDYSRTDASNIDFSGSYTDADTENDRLVLAKEGVDHGFLATTVKTNNPEWDYKSDLSDYVSDEWITTDGDASRIFQRQGYVEIDLSTEVAASSTGIMGIGTFNFPVSFDFYAATTGSCWVYASDGKNRHRFELPDTGGVWRWFRCIVGGIGEGDVSLFVDGNPVAISNDATATSVGLRISLYVQQGYKGNLKVGAFYVCRLGLGAPPPNHEYVTVVETEVPIENLVRVGSSKISWVEERMSIDDSDYASIEVQWKKEENVIPYTAASNGGEMPNINKGEDIPAVTSYKLLYTLKTKDSGNAVSIKDLKVEISSAYKTAGSYVSPLFDMPSVGKASEIIVSWEGNPTNVELSINGGAYSPITNGTPIKENDQSTELLTLQYRVYFVTDDIAITPTLESITVDVRSGYHKEKIVNIEPTDVSNIGEVLDSIVEWTDFVPPSTNVVIETSMDGTTWTAVEKGSSFLPPGYDLNGKTLYFRYVLSTSDTKYTPILSELTWRIAQSETVKIRPATATMILTPSAVSRWQLEKNQYPTGWHVYGTARYGESAYIPQKLNTVEGTVELWAYESGALKLRHLFDSLGPSRFALWRDHDLYYLRINGSNVTSQLAPSQGWRYISVRWKETDVAFFIDGEKKWEGILDKAFSFSGDKLYIGCNADGFAQWNGLIDDIRISDIARTDNEIVSNYNSGLPSPNDENTVFKAGFDGSLKPTVDTEIQVEGTAPTPAVFEVRFTQPTNGLRISNGEKYVLIITPFKEGDLLEIDCVKQVVKKNGVPSLAMPFLSLASDFFDLIPGGSVIVEPNGVATVDAVFTEKWR